MKKLILAFALLFVVGCYDSPEYTVKYYANADRETSIVQYVDKDGAEHWAEVKMPFEYEFTVDDSEHYLKVAVLADYEENPEVIVSFDGEEHVAHSVKNTGFCVVSFYVNCDDCAEVTVDVD